MHRQSFILLVISCMLIGAFLLIYKQTQITKLLYEQQTLEKERSALVAEQAHLTQQLFYLKNPAAVHHYAINTLGMKKISLSQVHRINNQSKGIQ